MQNTQPPTNWEQLQAAAQLYHSLGLTVVPVDRQKRPLGKFTELHPDSCLQILEGLSQDLQDFSHLSAKKSPLSDREVKQMEQLTKALQQPRSLTGIGLRTGDPILVIDLDLDEKLGDGRLHWQELLAEWGIEAPKTWQVQSGSGGQHLYFRWEARFAALGQNTKIGGKAIDLRTTNGYIVAPPSPWFDKKQEFAFTGRYYSWLDGCSPEGLEIGRLPEPAFEWLLLNTSVKVPKVPKPAKKGKKGKKGKKKAEGILPEGEEDDRDASPKRVHPPKYAHEIAELLLPLVCENEGGELDFRFSKYKNKSTLIFLRNGPDPAVCSICQPIREARGRPLEPHTSQNRCALLGVQAFLQDNWYRQVFIGCYAEPAFPKLVGWLVSDSDGRPLRVVRELPSESISALPRCLEQFQAYAHSQDNLLRELKPSDVPEEMDRFIQPQDTGETALFGYLYGSNVVYDKPGKTYYFFVGHTWHPDETGAAILQFIQRLAYCYTIAGLRCDSLKKANCLLKRAHDCTGEAKLRRIEWLLERDLSNADISWNTLTGYLPFRNGIVNMSTGQLEPGRPEHWFSLSAPIDWPGLEAACPIFEQTYQQCFGDNPEVLAFFQRLLGYTMSGRGGEDLLVFLTGEQGASGKSTLYQILTMVFGSKLIKQVPAEVLMLARSTQAGAAQPHLTQLEGVRLAVIEEGNEAHALNVTQAKALSGTKGTFRARDLYKGYRDIRALFTIFVLQNSFPRCPADEEALWRRIVNINMPYKHVTEHELTDAAKHRLKDPRLLEKLTPELPAIAAWAVRGYRDYLANGLQRPAAVQQATQEQRNELDSIGNWLQDCCLLGPQYVGLANDLFTSYRDYSEDVRMTKVTFGKKLSQRGFGPDRLADQRARRGLQLKDT
jgi:putative DNA primase/helicase